MGRPPGSKNQRREEPTPTVRPQVSSNGPTAEVKKRYLEDYRSRRKVLAGLMGEVAEARGGIRTILKAFAGIGGSPEMLKRMFELTNLSQEEAEATVQEYLGYAQDIGVRVYWDERGQGSMLDVTGGSAPPTVAKGKVTPDAALALARSYTDGWNSARAGGTVSDNPHRAGTQEALQWHRGLEAFVWEQEHGRNPGTPPAGPSAGDGQDLPADPA